MDDAYERLLQELDECDRNSTEFVEIVEKLKDLAKSGFYDACETIAELTSLEPSIYNPKSAYVWYYIALKHQGYRTELANEGTPDYYTGPEGDFRNEAMVSELVDEIGVQELSSLDQQAEEWITSHPALPAPR